MPLSFSNFPVFVILLFFEFLDFLEVVRRILLGSLEDGLPHQLVEFPAERVPLLLDFLDLLSDVLDFLVTGGRAPVPREQLVPPVAQLRVLVENGLVVLLVPVEKPLLGRHIRLDGLQVLAALEQLPVHLGLLFVEESGAVVGALLVANAFDLVPQVLQVAVLVLELLFEALDGGLLVEGQAALSALLSHVRTLGSSTCAGVRYARLNTLLGLIFSLPLEGHLDFLLQVESFTLQLDLLFDLHVQDLLEFRRSTGNTTFLRLESIPHLLELDR